MVDARDLTPVDRVTGTLVLFYAKHGRFPRELSQTLTSVDAVVARNRAYRIVHNIRPADARANALRIGVEPYLGCATRGAS